MFLEQIKLKYHYVKGLVESVIHPKKIQYSKNKKLAFVMLAAEYSNLGDIAITKMQIEFLKDILSEDYEIIMVPYQDTYRVFLSMKRIIKKDSLITLIGGGNHGSEYEFIDQPRRFILKYFRKNTIISFPQSYIYTPSNVSEERQNEFARLCKKCKDFTLVARENETYKKYKSLFGEYCNVILTPDIVFWGQRYSVGDRLDSISLILRNDKEKRKDNVSDDEIIKIAKRHFKICSVKDTCDIELNPTNKFEVLDEFIENITKSKLVITDRLHGMILSYITNTPCIVLKNTNKKIESTYYTWLKEQKNVKLLESRYAEDLEREIINMIDPVINSDKKECFSPLIEVIRNFKEEQ